MNVWIDEYAGLNSPIHRIDIRVKLTGLFVLIFAFSLVQDLRIVPVMAAITAILFLLSRLPLHFLWSRMRYPGVFLLAMALILPWTGETALLAVGPLTVFQEGLLTLALITSRFICILTIALIMFGTAPFLDTLHAMQRMGLPPLLVDMALLTWRYLFDIGDTLVTMERAMRLRGFVSNKFSPRGFRILATVAGTLLVRSYEQSERVYYAMKLRGYGIDTQEEDEALTASNQEPIALHMQGVKFAYPQHDAVLDGVSITIKAHERVGLIGPNGAGKTSLFLLVGGLLKPDAGTITLFDEPVKKGTFRQNLGLVFQNASDQLFSPTVREDIAFGPHNLDLTEDAIDTRVAEAMTVTGTSPLADRAPHHLSGGEKRMVAIAGVIAMQPKLVIYDEPDANLDIRARRRLIDFLQYTDHALLMSSHDLELILEVCDRVLLLDGGKIVADGTPEAIMNDEPLMAAHGLEKPHSLIPHGETPHHSPHQ